MRRRLPPSRFKSVTERRKTSPFERLLTEISTFFINLPADRIDDEIGAAQQSICNLLDIDRSTLWIVPEDEPEMLVLAKIHQPRGISDPPEGMNARDFFPWTTQKLLSGETVVISRFAELPAEAARDLETYRFYRAQSTVSIPMSVGSGGVFGALTFTTTRHARDWTHSIVQQFELVAQIFANALVRKQNEKALAAKLKFETLLADISAQFLNLPPGLVDVAIEDAQRRVCECLGLDRSSLFQMSKEKDVTLLLTHCHQPPDWPPPPERMDLRDAAPWAWRNILKGESLVISKMGDLPAAAARDRQTFSRYGTQSVVAVPLSVGGEPLLGLLTFAMVNTARTWQDAMVQQFELVAQIFANALARKQAEEELAERLRFETLLTDISASFVDLPMDKVDSTIEAAQRHVCECLGLDLAALWQFSKEPPGSLVLTHIYRSLEEPPLPQPMDAQVYFPWSLQEVEAGRTISVSSMAQLPLEASQDVESYSHFGIKSTLVFPMCTGDKPPLGALGFNAIRTERTWPEAIVNRLRLVTELFTHALALKQAENALAKSEQRLRMIANALPALIGYVDSEQRYRFNNLAYQEWFGFTPEEALGLTIREVIGNQAYSNIVPHLEEAFAGNQVTFTQALELSGGRQRTVEAIYVPEVDALGEVCGLYILAIDVTERDRALQESRRLQDDLLHASRIATMGELAGTLAHEINQPLSAIMSNAQAAIRFLQDPAPDTKEVGEILSDIVKEDARAGEVINRLRALLRKTHLETEPLDLNVILREVSGLLRSDAVIRGIQIAFDLDSPLPLVSGDRIQLQQVALNLLLNAFEAMDDCPKEERRVSIRTRRQGGLVQVSVTDKGRGIPAGETETIFNPYHSSKAHGLGLGLSICRSIMKRHQGRIWAESLPEGGSALHFSLPARQEA